MKFIHILRRYGSSALINRFIVGICASSVTAECNMASSVTSMGSSNGKSLENIRFDNVALKRLPIDQVTDNYTRQVPDACFSLVKSTLVNNPETVAYSKDAMQLLDVTSKTELDRSDFAEYFSGNKLLPGSKTASHCYCGHQFGYFSGQLGDGCALYLGEVVNSKNERWEIQLKGAGKTPYSRHADGRKVLRSSIREFLCSEAIHHLGIPTTRAGSCVTSDTTVTRDILYNGNPIQEKATIVLRIAPSFIRFGSFEIFKPVDNDTGRKGPSVGNTDLLHTLLAYVIESFFPEIWNEYKEDKEKMYIEFYKEVVRRTARLVAEWQCVGWCHGVLNTDNMSILGLTIDYGPFGFMDSFDPDFICNHSDDGGRYTYKKQPEICRWNCSKLAEAIQGAVPCELTKPHLDIFDDEFDRHYLVKMRKKLGLTKSDDPAKDRHLIESLLNTMHKTGADFTNSFRCLSRLPLPGSDSFDQQLEEVKEYLLSQCATVSELKKACEPKMDPRQFQMFMMIAQTNPDLLAQLGPGIKGLMQELERMEKAKEIKDMTSDEKTKKDNALWEEWLGQYIERLQMEVEGQSDLSEKNKKRIELMNKNNPKFILRNYIVQHAIEKAEKGDYSEVRKLLKILQNPFSETIPEGIMNITKADEDVANEDTASCSTQSIDWTYDSRPPEWTNLVVT